MESKAKAAQRAKFVPPNAVARRFHIQIFLRAISGLGRWSRLIVLREICFLLTT